MLHEKKHLLVKNRKLLQKLIDKDGVVLTTSESESIASLVEETSQVQKFPENCFPVHTVGGTGRDEIQCFEGQKTDCHLLFQICPQPQICLLCTIYTGNQARLSFAMERILSDYTY